MIRTLRMIAVFLSVIASAVTAANAGEPRFHPAPGAMPVIGRYVVTLADSVADDLIESSVKGLAMTYSAQLEPQHSPNVRQFTVTMALARARTLSADPRVREVVEIPQPTRRDRLLLEQSAGQKLFITKDGAVVLDKGGKVVTAYTAKEFDNKILDVLERATARQ